MLKNKCNKFLVGLCNVCLLLIKSCYLSKKCVRFQGNLPLTKCKILLVYIYGQHAYIYIYIYTFSVCICVMQPNDYVMLFVY